jgi:hypothetical protein
LFEHNVGTFVSLDIGGYVVGGQEYTFIRIRALRGFFILWMQVLVLRSGQELALLAETAFGGQKHISIRSRVIAVIFGHIGSGRRIIKT